MQHVEGSCVPELPPPFAGRASADPWGEARSGEAGTVLFDISGGRCRAAFCFAPDRPVSPAELRDLGVLAAFDALAWLAPPQVPVTIEEGALSVDGGRVGSVQAATGPGAVPEWAALGLDLAIDLALEAPGERPGETCLHEEGFGDVTGALLLEAVSRNLLLWLDTWQDEPSALTRAVVQRGPRLAAVP